MWWKSKLISIQLTIEINTYEYVQTSQELLLT